MINLKIPRAAYDAGWEVFLHGRSGGLLTDAVIDAAMPLAFAAELRELVRELETMQEAAEWQQQRSRELDKVIVLLRNRIAELDPEGLTT